MKRDRIPRYRERLLEFGIDEAVISVMESDVKAAVDDATETAKNSSPPSPDSIYKDVWADGGWQWRN